MTRKMFYLMFLLVGSLVFSSGCAAARITKLIDRLHKDLISKNGMPSKTMEELATYGEMAKAPILKAITRTDKQYNVSLVRTLYLMKDEIGPEIFPKLLANNGKGVAETSQDIIVDVKNIRNMTDVLADLAIEHDPRKAKDPKKTRVVFFRLMTCLEEIGLPPAVPMLLKVLHQPDAASRIRVLRSISKIYECYPFAVACRTLYRRYYDMDIYFTLRTIMLKDADIKVRYEASQAMENYTAESFGRYPRNKSKDSRKKEAKIIYDYDYWVSWKGGLKDFPNRPSPKEIYRRLGVKHVRK